MVAFVMQEYQIIFRWLCQNFWSSITISSW